MTREKRDCLLLHRIASAALDAAIAEHESSMLGEQVEVAEAPYGEGGGERPRDALHASYAWLNVNRTKDSNFMHTHQVDLWSAVYYINEGEPNAPGFGNETSGHMIFRAGPRPQAEGGPALSESGEERRTYFAVPPVPGTLWLFPGSMPHTVMPTVLPDGVDEPETPRISLGINFEVAVPPLPRPWRKPPSMAERAAAAEASGSRDTDSTAAADATAMEGLVTQTAASLPTAAAKRGGDEGDEEITPFLMLSASEAKERGFRDDEEVVMPMPVFSDSSDDE